jgi:hypothetical protein
MTPIPERIKRILEIDPYYHTCARSGSDCKGRITWEHAIIYAGKQVQEKWAIIPLCEYHHLGKGLDKQINIFIALSRATPEELKKYPRVDWEQEKKKAIYLIFKHHEDNTKVFWIDKQRRISISRSGRSEIILGEI